MAHRVLVLILAGATKEWPANLGENPYIPHVQSHGSGLGLAGLRIPEALNPKP